MLNMAKEEYFSKDGDDNTCLSVLNGTKHNALCMIQLIWHNYLLIKMNSLIQRIQVEN